MYFLTTFLVNIFLFNSLCATATTPTFRLPLVSFSDLLSLDKSASAFALNNLVTIGALQIVSIPNFDLWKKNALRNLPECLLRDRSAVASVLDIGGKKSGAHRRSVGFSSSSKYSSSGCTSDAMELRATVDAVMKQLFVVIDEAIVHTEASSIVEIMHPYRSFSDLMARGKHLEHFHAYYNVTAGRRNDDDNAATSLSSQMHTDAGLLIAMTTGHYSRPAVKNGLHMKLPSGQVVEILSEDDALLVLVGEAGARWLSPAALGGVALRAAPHAVRLTRGQSQGEREADNGVDGGESAVDERASLSAPEEPLMRSWYGKMFLPPADAIIKLSSSSGNSKSDQVTYEEYRRREVQILSARSSSSSHTSAMSAASGTPSFPSACGPIIATDAQILAQGQSSQQLFSSWDVMSSSTPCTVRADSSDGIMCWAQCVSVAGLTCGQQAQCTDTDTGELSDGEKMCTSTKGMHGCTPICPAVPSSSTKNSSSNTSALNTYNDYCYGSGSIMYMEGFGFSFSGGYECLNFIFVSWTLNTRGKFALACVATFSLGVSIQYLTKVRLRYFTMRTSKKAVGIALYGLQVMLSYIAMLLAMTYSVELLLMVCLGLTLGYALFLLKNPPPLTTDPCCAAVEETLNAIASNNDYNRLDEK